MIEPAQTCEAGANSQILIFKSKTPLILEGPCRTVYQLSKGPVLDKTGPFSVTDNGNRKIIVAFLSSLK